MELGAVVIIYGATGCVCEPRGKPAATTGGASTAAGAAVVQAMLEAQRESDSHHK